MKIVGINAINNSQNRKNNTTFKRNWSEHISWGANLIKEQKKVNFKLFSYPDAKAVFVEVARKANKSFGELKDRIVNIVLAQGAALSLKTVLSKDEDSRVYEMENLGDGIFEANDIEADEGYEYRYIVVKDYNDIRMVKDPYSKDQPNVLGWSKIYNPDNYEWKNTDWIEGKDSRRIVRKPNEPLRGLENLVIEEINIPTLSKEGTFDGAKAYIDKIAQRGTATAIEIMPVENTYSIQWGYDGVDKFAVNNKLGGPAKLKEFVDYAHGKGLNVILDMVPNHIGPDGDFLGKTGPYEDGITPWGAKFNYENKDNRYVRDMVANTALWWINEFKVDGLRLDMTKECKSSFFLKQVIDEVNEHNPDIFMIAEDAEKNREAITRYDDSKESHEDKLEMIDSNIDKIVTKKWKTTPHAIGFDSEWDFPLKTELMVTLLNPTGIRLDNLENIINNSQHRIKFLMSHDEIGNLDGTRMIPKVIATELDLYNRVDGITGIDSIDKVDKGQKAAQLSQKLAKLYLTEDISSIQVEELSRKAYNFGMSPSKRLYPSELVRAFNIAKAKHKMMLGTIFTIPGPKMYFQGDDVMDMSQFKFFREFTDDKERRQNDPSYIPSIYREKGYDTFIDKARPDSIIESIKPSTDKYAKEIELFTKDLSKITKGSEALTKGNIINSHRDDYNKILVQEIKSENDDIIVIRNYGANFHTQSYDIPNFPEGNWKEVFNSDHEKYGGSNFINEFKGDIISATNQRFNIAPNSIIILQKV